MRSEVQIGHSWRVPLPFRQALLHEGSVGLRGGREFSLVPALVTEPACGGDVADHVLASVLLGHQMLGGATEQRSCSRAQTERLQFIG